MVDRLTPDRGILMSERAELVVVVLEGVRGDRAERDAEVVGVRAQRTESHMSHGMCRATVGASAVCLLTCAASAIFSKGSRGVPGVPNTLKRVPELPNADLVPLTSVR